VQTGFDRAVPADAAGMEMPHTAGGASVWSMSMGNIKSIEKAVEALPPEELAEFRRWFAEFDAAAWDKQIDNDAASGKLDGLAAEALADYRAGNPREL
jgi:hypothetical protein